MQDTNNQDQANQIIEDIKSKKKITSGKYAKIIDGKVYVLQSYGGNYGYVPPYPKSVGTHCPSQPKKEGIDTNPGDNCKTYHKTTKIIDGKVYIMQHDGGFPKYVKPYPKHLDNGTYSQKIQKNTDENTDENTFSR